MLILGLILLLVGLVLIYVVPRAPFRSIGTVLAIFGAVLICVDVILLLADGGLSLDTDSRGD